MKRREYLKYGSIVGISSMSGCLSMFKQQEESDPETQITTMYDNIYSLISQMRENMRYMVDQFNSVSFYAEDFQEYRTSIIEDREEFLRIFENFKELYSDLKSEFGKSQYLETIIDNLEKIKLNSFKFRQKADEVARLRFKEEMDSSSLALGDLTVYFKKFKNAYSSLPLSKMFDDRIEVYFLD